MLEFLLNNDFLSALIAFALVLIPAIIIHEFGHLLAAKMIGVNVLEFGIGFPPRALKLFRWGETDFTLNWLPIGGFVRPLGEDMIGPVYEETADEDEQDDEKRKNNTVYISEREELRARGVADEDMVSLNEAKPWPRIFFMAAGALANFLSALVFLTIAALIGIPVIMGARMQVDNLPADSALAQAGVENGDFIERFNDAYFANPEELFDRLAAAEGERVTLTMRRVEADPEDEDEVIETTYDVAFVPNAPTSHDARVLVSAVFEDSPGSEAGIQAGDFITSINGEPFTISQDPVAVLQTKTRELAGQRIDLTLLRDGETVTLAVNLRSDDLNGRIGIGVQSVYAAQDNGILYFSAPEQQELVPQSLGAAVQHAFNRVFEMLRLIVSLPGMLIDGTLSPEEARPVSVIGVSQVGGQLLQQSIRQGAPVIILDFIAIVSIFLGFTNLLPLPPLDGGRILFVLIEIIRGKPVPPEIEGLVYRVGIALLLGLGLIIILYDIFNPLVLPQ